VTKASANRPEASNDAGACRNSALNALARREHSRLELERKLAARGYATDVVATTLDALETAGLLDAGRFSDSFVRSRQLRGQGPARIQRELTARGIDPEQAGQALTDSDADWLTLARRVRERKFGAEIPQDYKERAKQMRFLQYRGFSNEQIRAAMESGSDGE
jgi:regulatory protein